MVVGNEPASDRQLWALMLELDANGVRDSPVGVGDCQLGNRTTVGLLVGCYWVEQSKKNRPNIGLIFFYVLKPACRSLLHVAAKETLAAGQS